MIAAVKLRAVAGEHQLPLRRGGAALPVRQRRPARASSTSGSTGRAIAAVTSRAARRSSHLVMIDDGTRRRPRPASTRVATTTRSAAGSVGPRLRRTVVRRPVDHLHGRHHRHAEGRDVAPGGHLLRPRAAASTRFTRERVAHDHVHAREAAAANPGPAHLPRGAAPHARCRAGRDDDEPAAGQPPRDRAPSSTAEAVWRLVAREGINSILITGDAMGRAR